ncbi:hypothetical protein NDU88_006460 [Pleurodeles waltl]|uniref:Uncharacterized protein n=1 Tax=Pleurodeles waltl TaxID=8319 RepID=A0AAV7SPU4_PLEWA|nr:hypothetical protein NDU88_006460 [Pleurodeles waltl]
MRLICTGSPSFRRERQALLPRFRERCPAVGSPRTPASRPPKGNRWTRQLWAETSPLFGSQPFDSSRRNQAQLLETQPGSLWVSRGAHEGETAAVAAAAEAGRLRGPGAGAVQAGPLVWTTAATPLLLEPRSCQQLARAGGSGAGVQFRAEHPTVQRAARKRDTVTENKPAAGTPQTSPGYRWHRAGVHSTQHKLSTKDNEVQEPNTDV